MIYDNAAALFASSTKTICWSMIFTADLCCATSITTGSVKNSFASFFTFWFIVALNIMICLFGPTLGRIFSISSKNPISSIVSTSSITTVVTLDKSTVPFFKCSINLPEVATKISRPFAIFFSCSFVETPPNTASFWTSKYLPKSSAAFDIWLASSLVGTNIKVLRTGLLGCLFAINSVNIGNKNAAVFPVPLWAAARISLFFKAIGIAFFCISVASL